MTKLQTNIFSELTLGLKLGQQIFGPGDFITANNNVTKKEDILFIHLIKDFEYIKEEQQLNVTYIVENINHQERDRYENTERLVNPQQPLFVSIDVPLDEIANGNINIDSFNGEIFENKGADLPTVLEVVVTKNVYRLDFEQLEDGTDVLRVHVKADPLVPVSEEIKTEIAKSVSKAKLNLV